MVYFTSDLHLGHQFAAVNRGFTTYIEHDDYVIEQLEKIPKKAKLIVLGDIAFKNPCTS